MRKRLLSFLLALCMVLPLLPAEALAARLWEFGEEQQETVLVPDALYPSRAALAESEADEEVPIWDESSIMPYTTTVDYELENGAVLTFEPSTGTIIECTLNDATEIIIPEKVEGVSVKKIGDYAFYACSGLTSVTIPDSVTSVGDYAFYACSRLTSVTMPATASTGNYAFYGCTFVSYVRLTGVGEMVSYRGSYSGYITYDDFGDKPWGCNTTTIDIESGVTSICEYAFFNCSNLISVTIPNSVTVIGDGAFYECRSLTSIAIPNNVTTIESSTFGRCSSLRNIVIPNSVTTIGSQAFSSCSSLKNIEIPNSVTTIEFGAFSSCSSLSGINVASGNPVYSSVDGVLFNAGQTLLHTYPAGKGASYSIPYGVTSIGSYAFYRSNLTSVNIPGSVTNIGWGAFYNCSSLFNVDIPDSVIEIEGIAFEECNSLSSVYIPSGVTNIWGGAFNCCSSLTSIDVSSDNPTYSSVDGVLFNADQTLLHTYPAGKSGASYSIPYGVTSIGYMAFRGCGSLTSVIIPNSVTSIDRIAFGRCSNLTSVTIPNSVTSIGGQAFIDCSNLTSVTIPNSVTFIEEQVFFGVHENFTIYCYKDSVAHQYAIEHNIPFVLLDGVPGQPGTAQILRLSPQSGAEDVSYDSENPPVFQIIFDRPIASIEAAAGTLSIYRTSDDELLYSASTAADFQFNGATLTVTPGIQLEPATEYYITLESAAIQFEDDAMNSAIVRGQWQFKTAPTELSTIDLLALSLLSYENPLIVPEEKYIRVLIAYKWDEYWDENWEKVNIRNNELFANLADWKVYDYLSDKSTGFAAYAFYNDSNEFVIAYRGSETSWKDWVENDIWMFVGGEGSQLSQAMAFYNSVATKSGSNNITVTGHSLGGALADIIAACYDCQGESFNSAQFLDVAYWYHPEEMSAFFEGTDAFKFKAHANESDNLVGNNSFETIKPLWLYKDNGLVNGLFGAHNLASIVVKGNDGSLELTKCINDWEPKVVSQKVTVFLNNKVVLGTTMSNDLKYSEYSLAGTNLYWNYAVYGGAGADNIITNATGDTISGGKGNDTIDGGWGGDTYIYYKGHGIDTIHDTSGHDELLLLGFNRSDVIRVEEGDDTYAYVTVNGSIIVKIAKRRSNPVTGWNNSFKISSNQGFNQNIENILVDKRDFFERLLFSCPVNVEIVNDATGKVVYTLYDQIDTTDYTDYGNFYVFEQEDGEYVKIADLIEGYSVHVVGVGDGKMDAVVLDTDGFNLSGPYTVQNVPVTKGMVATVEENADGGKNLVIDTDADGQPDLTVPLTANETDSEEQPSGGTDKPNTPNTVLVTSVTLDRSSISIRRGSNETLVATVSPSNASNKNVTWKSSDESIAAVNQNGVVTGVSVGMVTIMVTTENGGYTASCTVTVTASESGGNGSSSGHTGGSGYSGSTSRATSKGANSGSVSTGTTVVTPSTTNIFTDVLSIHTFATEIAWARGSGIISGYSDGTFRPDNNTNRQQMWMVLARMSGTYPANMAEARTWAVNSGISDGTNPQNPMSRQQLVTMLYRFALSQGVEISGPADLSAYPDNGAVASYAQEALAWAVGNSIVTGTSGGRLNPEGTATRAHFAAFLYRYSNLTPSAGLDNSED